MYLKKFVIAIASANYGNLNKFFEFKDDERFNKIDMLKIAIEMQEKFKIINPKFVKVVTEMGICQTTSKLYNLQTPYKNSSIPTSPGPSSRKCQTGEICKSNLIITNWIKNVTNKIVSSFTVRKCQKHLHYHNSYNILFAYMQQKNT